ncbi:MAG: (Fe-S)-binding protein [Parvibaculales bacterium]
MNKDKAMIGLFVSCSVDLMRPSIGFASVKLLEDAGYQVEAPPQSCCGQIGYNAGEPEEAKKLAWKHIELFKEYKYIVIPSGSCAAMMQHHYPKLFANDKRIKQVQKFSAKTYELSSFLQNIASYKPSMPFCNLSKRACAYHDSCSGMREGGIIEAPRKLLRDCAKIEVMDLANREECCGFGGMFCIKYADISNHMVTRKLEDIAALKADMLLGGDLSCLLNIAGKAKRIGQKLEIRHFAEVAAGMLDIAPIGESL